MKKIRLLIAKWALAPKNISSEDILQVVGIDLSKHVENAVSDLQEAVMQRSKQTAKDYFEKELKNQIETSAKGVAAKDIGDLSPAILSAVIAQSKTLREDQKTALLGILSDSHADFYR